MHTDHPFPDLDVERVWRDFWLPIVKPVEVEPVDIQLIKNELYDYHAMLGEVAKVYCEITGGRISKQNTSADAVIGVYTEDVQRQIDDAVSPFKSVIAILIGACQEAMDWVPPPGRAMLRDAIREAEEVVS